MYCEVGTKPPIHNLIHEFLVSMDFTMACPNFKKGLKMAFGPLGFKIHIHEHHIAIPHLGNLCKHLGKAPPDLVMPTECLMLTLCRL